MTPARIDMQFVVGDSVRWESQAGGRWVVKAGTVVEVVPAGSLPRDNRTPRMAIMPRKHESYVVRVGKSALYWPLVSHLRLVVDG